MLAFVISAAVTGLGGALLAHQIGYLTPEGFGLILSLELVLMVTIGGLGSLRGAILGAILISMLPTFISRMKPLLPDVIAKRGVWPRTFRIRLDSGPVRAVRTGGTERAAGSKFKASSGEFPIYRKDMFKRGKSYKKSERYK